MLFLTESEIRELLPVERAIRLLHDAFEAYAADRAANQPRRRLALASGSILHSMAGAYGPYFGTKIYSTNPTHGAWFLFVLYEAETGKPLALFEANHLGQIRTGAATGLAASLLSPGDARTLAIIGSGFQARTQLEAVAAVRKIESVRVFSRKPEKRRQFAHEMSRSLNLEVDPVDSARDAVIDAAIVITATYARDPVLDSAWISPGTFIAAVGSNHPQRRELPADLVQTAGLLVADSVEQARIEAGDLILALDSAGWQRVVELRDVVAAPHRFNTGSASATVFKPVGLGLEDVAAAAYVYEQALGRGAGSKLPIFHS